MRATFACLGTAAAIALAAPAFAGSPAPAPAEPPIVAPAAPSWTGFYAGGELGWGRLEGSGGGQTLDDSGVIGGLTAGYDYDFGTWVAGVRGDYDWSNISISVPVQGAPNGKIDLDHVWRIMLRGGPKVGTNGLAYLTAGYANMQLSTSGGGVPGTERNDGGYAVGAGYDHLVNQNVSVGAEILYHNFNDFDNSGTDFDLWTVMARAAYRF